MPSATLPASCLNCFTGEWLLGRIRMRILEDLDASLALFCIFTGSSSTGFVATTFTLFPPVPVTEEGEVEVVVVPFALPAAVPMDWVEGLAEPLNGLLGATGVEVLGRGGVATTFEPPLRGSATPLVALARRDPLGEPLVALWNKVLSFVRAVFFGVCSGMSSCPVVAWQEFADLLVALLSFPANVTVEPAFWLFDRVSLEMRDPLPLPSRLMNLEVPRMKPKSENRDLWPDTVDLSTAAVVEVLFRCGTSTRDS